MIIGLTLFSMFFGAGNLIFPPFLGAQAGTNTWIAMAGFAVTAIGFPILGVAAVARSGGLLSLAGRVHPKFAFFFTLLIYLSIGPCLAIPRTASTSFEMAIVPFIGDNWSLSSAQAVYSVVFFTIACILAMRPDKLSDRLGKVLTPCLLVLIAAVFLGCVIHPLGQYGVPEAQYVSAPLIKGFLEGYLTMDTIAALNFGIIISLNIKAMGIVEEKYVIRETIKAGMIAGIVLLAVYGGLAHIGAVAGGTFGVVENGARVLTLVVRSLFGNGGMVLLAIIFFIACLNTCVGLLSCCSKYFCTMISGIRYGGWVVIFAVISVVISNIGLNKILELSVPVLNAIYPVAIVLIVLSFMDPFIKRYRYAYPAGIFMTGVVSVTAALEQSGIVLPVLTKGLHMLFLYEVGLEWMMPAVAGTLLGIIISLKPGGGKGSNRS